MSTLRTAIRDYRDLVEGATTSGIQQLEGAIASARDDLFIEFSKAALTGLRASESGWAQKSDYTAQCALNDAAAMVAEYERRIRAELGADTD